MENLFNYRQNPLSSCLYIKPNSVWFVKFVFVATVISIYCAWHRNVELVEKLRIRLIVTRSANDENRGTGYNIKLTDERLKIFEPLLGITFIAHVHIKKYLHLNRAMYKKMFQVI